MQKNLAEANIEEEDKSHRNDTPRVVVGTPDQKSKRSHSERTRNVEENSFKKSLPKNEEQVQNFNEADEKVKNSRANSASHSNLSNNKGEGDEVKAVSKT
mmetsp:Transcript_40057/g.29555  ORF Transcript_40057/g.29555 Transcript_40057/m.29555 type:complete len:100 (-) Transcript_40057:30-329(-)|eukprot:CAMPEP_0202970290 /NCGR_PEP_ID=MMETSP1396-20130829/16263_1 /ASSEMBLY_ACC=CAM_ASM_000872 /TAXON_ID= /ORGANISM="Pseudokeronopsis sp., Strain Brazil" /LENGTH=99 /DNA_ID=CAMNT_0049698697 /DNA_START=206 /DNA_END=505 /DNA_ORIENTATION=-